MTEVFEPLGEDRWYSATLRLFGDSLDLEDAREQLPSASVQLSRKGDHIQNNPRFAKNRTNICLVSFGKSSAEPWEPRLLRLLETAEPLSGWLAHVRNLGVTTEVFLGYSSETGQGGGGISAETLSRIAALGLSLDLDLYPPET